MKKTATAQTIGTKSRELGTVPTIKDALSCHAIRAGVESRLQKEADRPLELFLDDFLIPQNAVGFL